MRIVAYVDGFSVYYSCFSGPTKEIYSRLKWLDYQCVFESLFPDDSIEAVRLFTAIMPNPLDNPNRASRHDVYLRALRATGVDVHVGRFQKAKREGILVHPHPDVPRKQTVHIFQEKKSDVSLASHLIADGFQNRFDCAVVLTNDTDFATPIQMTRELLSRDVIAISPDIAISGELKKLATAGWVLDRGLLYKCQLPNPVTDIAGREIFKPESW